LSVDTQGVGCAGPCPVPAAATATASLASVYKASIVDGDITVDRQGKAASAASTAIRRVCNTEYSTSAAVAVGSVAAFDFAA
jgi:hypothetical protein